MSTLNWKTTLVSVAAVGALVWAPASFAQGMQGQGRQGTPPQGQRTAPPPGQPPGGQASIDDATLDKFASAYGEIQEIHDDYSGRLQEVDNQDEAMELQREAQGEMLQVVRENDLSVREYNHVATMMNQDPELRERVHRKVGQ